MRTTSGLVAWIALTTGAKSVIAGGYRLSYTILRPAVLAFSRAPSEPLIANSKSAAAIAIVCGFGFCAAAMSKKPLVCVDFGFGPNGIMEKYFGYLNSAFTASPNRPTNTFCL